MADSALIDSPSLLVFSDDWGRHPSSCQHLVRHLVPERHVWWINTIGMRAPTMDRGTVRRGLEKLRAWSRGRQIRGRGPNESPRAEPKNVALVQPSPRSVAEPGAAPTAISAALRLSTGPVVAVTTIPLVADLVGRLPVARWVYYCVDDFSEWPGLDHRAIRVMEERLVRRADVLIAVSEKLQERLAAWGRESHLLTHGVDLEHWTSERPHSFSPLLQGVERPVILFWGAVDRRLDLDFLAALSRDLDCGTIVRSGPQAADPAIARLKRVACLPPVPYEQLPQIAREAAVLVMPYADLPVTRAMQPLKLKEYLATGRPVVVRDLPATRCWADALELATTPQEFCASCGSG